MDAERQKTIEQARKSLERMQNFDAASLPRVEELGSAVNFKDAIEPATRLIDLYRQLPSEVLDQLPRSFLDKIRNQADSDFNILNSILQFEPGSSKQDRDNRLNSLRQAYDPTFMQLHDAISYSVRKSTDFSRLEREARASVQNVSDRATELQNELERRKKDADEILVAAGRWLSRTGWLTVLLAVYATATLFLHKIPLLVPTNGYETAQLAVSKVLVFATISFFLFLSARNYVAHRHNAVVNRHRQNALATLSGSCQSGR